MSGSSVCSNKVVRVSSPWRWPRTSLKNWRQSKERSLGVQNCESRRSSVNAKGMLSSESSWTTALLGSKGGLGFRGPGRSLASALQGESAREEERDRLFSIVSNPGLGHFELGPLAPAIESKNEGDGRSQTSPSGLFRGLPCLCAIPGLLERHCPAGTIPSGEIAVCSGHLLGCLDLRIFSELGWLGNESEVLAAGVLFSEVSLGIDSGVCLGQRGLLDCLWKGEPCTLKGRDERSSSVQLEPPEGWCASRLPLASTSPNLGGSECALPSPDWMRLSIIPGVVHWNGNQGCSWANLLSSMDAGDWGVTLAEEPDCPCNWPWRSIEAQRGVGGEAANGGEFGKWTPACQLVLPTGAVKLTEDEGEKFVRYRVNFVDWDAPTTLKGKPTNS